MDPEITSTTSEFRARTLAVLARAQSYGMQPAERASRLGQRRSITARLQQIRPAVAAASGPAGTTVVVTTVVAILPMLIARPAVAIPIGAMRVGAALLASIAGTITPALVIPHAG